MISIPKFLAVLSAVICFAGSVNAETDAQKVAKLEAAVAAKMEAQAHEWNKLSDAEKLKSFRQSLAPHVDWKSMSDREKEEWKRTAAKNAKKSDAQLVKELERAIAKSMKEQARKWEKLSDAEKLQHFAEAMHNQQK